MHISSKIQPKSLKLVHYTVSNSYQYEATFDWLATPMHAPLVSIPLLTQTKIH